MKPNLFKKILDEGGKPVGHMLVEFASRGMAQIMDAAGVDFAVIDMEHGAYTLDQLADIVAWMKATPIAPFVRIAEIKYHLVARALDVGVLGIMAPNVKTAQAAQTLVDAAKYPPLGNRGLYFGGSSSDYRVQSADEYTRYANDNTTIICMIESPEGVENADQIASVNGVDALWVGHWDLTQYMGIRGQFKDQRFKNAVRHVTDTAHKHDLVSAIQPGNPNQLKEFLDLGFDVISCGNDFMVYGDALAHAVTGVRKAVEG